MTRERRRRVHARNSRFCYFVRLLSDPVICLRGLLTGVLLAVAPWSSVQAQLWVWTTTRDTITDRNTTVLSLPAVRVTNGSPWSATPRLIVRCRDETLAIWLTTNEALHHDDNEGITIRERWASEESAYGRWITGRNAGDAFHAIPRETLGNLRAYSRLVLQMSPAGRGWLTVVFTIPPMPVTAYRQIVRDCNL